MCLVCHVNSSFFIQVRFYPYHYAPFKPFDQLILGFVLVESLSRHSPWRDRAVVPRQDATNVGHAGLQVVLEQQCGLVAPDGVVRQDCVAAPPLLKCSPFCADRDVGAAGRSCRAIRAGATIGLCRATKDGATNLSCRATTPEMQPILGCAAGWRDS